jgi:hydroxyacylglutathione hydrolase
VAVPAQDAQQVKAHGCGREVIEPREGSTPDVRGLAVGPIQENSYIVRASASASSALLIDPGEEPQRLLDAASGVGARIEAILITHCHFDHVGAVAPIARATGAPVYCPEIEIGVLADIQKWTMPGFGPYESYNAEHTVKGGERLSLAGMDIEVLFTPGHSPGHVTYAIGVADIGGAEALSSATDASTPGERDVLGEEGSIAPPTRRVLLSGDVLFEGSVGRADLPGSDWATLERSIGMLMARFRSSTVVYPGHMGTTTLGREWSTNPFLSELRASAASPSRP